MPKHCQKYQHDREEPYFHSGIDGSLFISGWEKFLTNSEYCVDYFYAKDEKDPSADVIEVSDAEA